MEKTKRHPFSYTLGPGPYRFVGFGEIIFDESFGSKYVGPELDTGCGTCSHCSHGIKNIYIVLTGDGKRMGVGSDCILKINHEGEFKNLTELEKLVRNQKRIKAAEARERARVKKAKAIFEIITENSEALSLRPHPSAYHASQGKTLLDYVNFVYRNGHLSSGSSDLLKYKIFKEIGESK